MYLITQLKSKLINYKEIYILIKKIRKKIMKKFANKVIFSAIFISSFSISLIKPLSLIPSHSLSFPLIPSHSLSFPLIPSHSLSFPLISSHSLSFPLIPSLTLSLSPFLTFSFSLPLFHSNLMLRAPYAKRRSTYISANEYIYECIYIYIKKCALHEDIGATRNASRNICS